VSNLVHPEWLVPAAALLLGVALALGLARRRARRRLSRLMHEGASAPSAFTRDAALLLAFAALLAALIGPRFALRERRMPASGVDVALLVDVSRSMEAADTPPSRLARALRAADELLAQLGPGDRVAIAAFAGRGVLLTPLTPDHEAMRELLGGLDTELIQPRGSALAAGVRAALAAFEAGSERPRVLLVLSDGEDSGGGRELPTGEANRAEVRVLAAGFGREEGAMLPDHGASLLDAGGLPVVTRRSMAPLERLAEASGGEVFRADASGTLDTQRVARALHRDAGRAGGFVVRRERAPLVLPLAALAFALLLLEGLPAPRAPRLGRRAAAAAALCLLTAGPLAQGREAAAQRGEAERRRAPAESGREAAAQRGEAERRRAPAESGREAAAQRGEAERRRAPAREVALRLQRAGLARLERGDAEGAIRALRAAALATREPALAALAYYHLGVSHLAAGELEEARLAFFDALALDPEDAAARFDLEWTLAALARRPPPPPAQAAGEKPAVKRPQPAPEAPPRSEAEPAPGQKREPAQVPPTLSGEERRRLLNRVPDDPSRALRLTARSDLGGATARGEGPAW
jgi:Ca-activated chloride channel family protein